VHTHVIYAYSDDRGNTWYKVTGERLDDLPLTVENATVPVDHSSEQDLWAGAAVAAYSPSQPVICFSTSDGSTALNWNGSEWIPVTAPWTTAHCFGRPDGEVCFFRPHVGLMVTRDSGQTWTGYPQQPNTYNGGSEKVDVHYYAQTGDFRWQSSTDDNTKIVIYTYEMAALTVKPRALRQGYSAAQNITANVQISVQASDGITLPSQAYVLTSGGILFSLCGQRLPTAPDAASLVGRIR
jgi:hypothetical protein